MAPGHEQPPPQRVGRYRIGQKIGEGGMGMVFVAIDETLERKVAIKLLRPDRVDATSRPRMLREAKALARLSHPNIVPVYEAGELEDVVYLAMEHVEGRTLREVLADPNVDARARLDLFLQAGEGLAAAHAAGLVHRDFKPANVLVGDDGRVRVVDFGLARPIVAEAVGPRTTEETQVSDDDLSRTGAVAGTPAYMSPEQRFGQPIDARSDQFSFCVAAWEALCGNNPVRGAPIARFALGELELVADEPHGRVSRAVRRALTRGLAREPGDRHASMDTLLGLLRPRSMRRTALLGVGLAGAVGGAAAAGVAVAGWDDSAERCDRAAAEISADYGEAQRAEIAKTWESTTSTEVARALGQLDRFVDAWTESRRTTCLAGAHESGSRARYERQVSCLDRQRAALQTVVEALFDPRRGIAPAVRGLDALPLPSRCSDPADVDRMEPPEVEPEALESRRALASQIARFRARIIMRDLEDGSELDLLRAEADRAADVPMQAEVELLRGLWAETRADYPQAAEALEHAFELAERSGHEPLTAEASIWLVMVTGDRLANGERSQAWRKIANAKVARSSTPALRARLTQAEGMVAFRQGRVEESWQTLDEAVSLWRAARGDSSPVVATVLESRSLAERYLERPEAAQVTLDEVVTLRTQLFGADHPLVAAALFNKAGPLQDLGELDAARAQLVEVLALMERHPASSGVLEAPVLLSLAQLDRDFDRTAESTGYYERALATAEQAVGSEHPLSARIRASWSGLEAQVGNYERAQALALAALAAQERRLGPEHPELLVTLNGLGLARKELGDLDGAEAAHQRAISIGRLVYGADTTQVVAHLTNLGDVAARRGDHEAEYRLLEEVLKLERRKWGPTHPNLVLDYFYLGRNAMERKAYAEAGDWFAKGAKLDHPAPVVRGELEFGWARALDAQGRWGIEQAQRARVAFAGEQTEMGRAAVSAIDDWLKTHRQTMQRRARKRPQ